MTDILVASPQGPVQPRGCRTRAVYGACRLPARGAMAVYNHCGGVNNEPVDVMAMLGALRSVVAAWWMNAQSGERQLSGASTPNQQPNVGATAVRSDRSERDLL